MIRDVETWREEPYPETSHRAATGLGVLGGRAVAMGVLRGLVQLELVDAVGFLSLAGEACGVGAQFIYGRFDDDDDAAASGGPPFDDNAFDLPFAASPEHREALEERHPSKLKGVDFLVPRRSRLPVPLFAAQVVGPSRFPEPPPLVVSPVAVGPFAEPRDVATDEPYCCVLENAVRVGGLVSTFAFGLEAIQGRPFDFYRKEAAGSVAVRDGPLFTLRRALDLVETRVPTTVRVFAPPATVADVASVDAIVAKSRDSLTPLLQRGVATLFLAVEDNRVDVLSDVFEEEEEEEFCGEKKKKFSWSRVTTKRDDARGIAGGTIVNLALLWCGRDFLDDRDFDGFLSKKIKDDSARRWFDALPLDTRRRVGKLDRSQRDDLRATYVAWLVLQHETEIRNALHADALGDHPSHL